MEETSMELGQLVDEAKLADIPVLVYGNKSDLMNAMEQCEIEESVAPVLKGRNYFVVECSAKTGKGLQDGMEWLVDQINKGAFGSLKETVTAGREVQPFPRPAGPFAPVGKREE